MKNIIVEIKKVIDGINSRIDSISEQIENERSD